MVSYFIVNVAKCRKRSVISSACDMVKPSTAELTRTPKRTKSSSFRFWKKSAWQGMPSVRGSQYRIEGWSTQKLHQQSQNRDEVRGLI